MERTTSTTATATRSRPATPDTDGHETIELQPQHRGTHGSHANPFTSPYPSVPPSVAPSAAASTTGFTIPAPQPRYFHSRRIKKGTLEKPWIEKKDPREKWVTIIPVMGIVVGLLLSGLIIYQGMTTVQKHVYCSVYEDDFSSGRLDPKVWTKEVEVGGFGYVSCPYTRIMSVR